MTTSKAVISLLKKQHPHSEPLLRAFVPLLEAQDSLAAELPPPPLPPLDKGAFAQGKPWLPVQMMGAAQYCDNAFLGLAPKRIAAAVSKGIPGQQEAACSLADFLLKNPEAGVALIDCKFQEKMTKIRTWAKTHAQETATATLFSVHLAAAAARRMERATHSFVLPAWNKSYCPVCGSRPHGSCLKGKEGRRFLHCSLCRHEWGFSRTTCPACEQEEVTELPLFFLEERRYERAEACNRCHHYLLGVDMRELSSEVPLELHLLCMMPLDMLMQEKGFLPISSPGH